MRMVVHGGVAGDPLQLLEKAEKQRWMLIASVAFNWGRGEIASNRMVVHGGAAGDPLQPLEKAEKQRWMLIAGVAFGWGRGEVTMCSNIIREVGVERWELRELAR
ncbi:hypothetical protein POTOM_026554 [Populus tomentosa]|uniref:Uncharacterized protein n=1 Tax=Populus tomentosa TaxID=118781 RepID=A0A8X8CY89_POPTO|nr:hypothetical protein POTOM_026554 [Populus tomentosa]